MIQSIAVAKVLTAMYFIFGSDYWKLSENKNCNMKRLIELVRDFLRREWFLLVTLLAIALIILLFELL